MIVDIVTHEIDGVPRDLVRWALDEMAIMALRASYYSRRGAAILAQAQHRSQSPSGRSGATFNVDLSR